MHKKYGYYDNIVLHFYFDTEDVGFQ
jgi:hypothetical protein